MAVYFLAQIRMDKPEEYQRYLDKVDEVFSKFGGKYLAVDSNPTLLEGAWPDGRIVLIGFPDEPAFRRWYFSPEYQEILQHRLRGATCNAVMVHGLGKA